MAPHLLLALLAMRRRFDRRDRWTREQLEAHQATALRAVRSYAVERSPFYRRLHAGQERAARAALPIVTKSMLPGALLG
jgi:phenylacetate-coenzyme A ligase PaaK-like adenylate-forming protein